MASIPGKELAVCSDDMFHLSGFAQTSGNHRRRLYRLGVCRYSSGLGVQTTLCYRAELPLRGFDETLRRHTAAEMTKRGIILRPQTAPESIEKNGKRVLGAYILTTMK